MLAGMKWWRRWVVVVAGALVNGVACNVAHSCTDVGCVSGVHVRVAPEGNVWPAGNYAVALSLDGETSACSFSIPEDLPARGAVATLSCGYLSQLAACREIREGGAVIHECEPLDGQYELNIAAAGEHSSLALTLAHDGSVVLDHTEDPVYTVTSPNGPECSPHCRNANVEVTF
jgi:hypothetical protein